MLNFASWALTLGATCHHHRRDCSGKTLACVNLRRRISYENNQLQTYTGQTLNTYRDTRIG